MEAGVTEFQHPEPPSPAPIDGKEDAPVEIHKPKPVHSWRELLTEIGVVVISITIALAAEQVVEEVHWRNQVAESRELLGNELALSMSWSIYRVRPEGCLENRLDALTKIVDDASKTGVLPPVPETGNPPITEWPDDVWNAVVASQTATHMPPKTLQQLSSAYAAIEGLRTSNKDELLVWTKLNTMAGPGRRLDPASEADLRSALSEARYYDRVMALAGGQLVETIQSLQLPHRDAQNVIDNALHFNINDHVACKGWGTDVPSQYGQAPFAAYKSTIEDWQKHPPYSPG
ncbi:MAG: hypothetical protein JWM33_2608 [Caulobacteraceae bacterium]|nr:hypothetical protein [Caulobacteraceae bacterium]